MFERRPQRCESAARMLIGVAERRRWIPALTTIEPGVRQPQRVEDSP
jgi:hypothetical protein